MYMHTSIAPSILSIDFLLKVNAKKRWIDPLAADVGRVSAWNEEVRRQMEEFCAQDFGCWLSAE